MTVAITGATGHVGANLVRAFIARGRRPRCLVHVNTQPLEGLDVDIVRGDVCDLDSLCRVFSGVEVVYHLAGSISLSMKDWPKLEAINVTGTGNVIEACLRTGVRRLVHFSSIHALKQEPFSIPVDENRPPTDDRNCPPYDRSKAAAEKEVKRGIERGLDIVIINPTAIMGPYDFQPSYLGEAILSMAQHKLPSLITGGFDWVDVRDVADGAIRAEEKAPAGAKYLLSGLWVSMCDMAAMIAEITGAQKTKLVCPLWLARAAAPVVEGISLINGKRPLYTSASLRALRSNRQISHEKAMRELGYQSRPFRETLEDTLNWFMENGKLPRRAETKEAASH